MNNFEIIENDKELLEIYKKVHEHEIANKGWCHHDINHIKNVAKIAEKILKELGYSKNIIEETKIAVYLHDTGCTEGKENHPYRSYEFAKKYLKGKNIKLKNEEMVLDAIKNHSEGFDTDNIIALALILGDKLDIKHNRITEYGYTVEGNRQLQYIKDILVNIKNKTLTVKFECDEKLDKLELEKFYFTKKVFKAIIAFSNKLNLNYKIFLNNEEWNEKNILEQ